MELPIDFVKELQLNMSNDLYEALWTGLHQKPLTSVRINPFKAKEISSWQNHVPQFNQAVKKVEWCKNGYYLSQRPNFTVDPVMHGGLYYVQEASSMFLDTIIRQLVKQPVRMLDLCAAPGGKTTCVLSALPQGSQLVCNEPIRQRAQILNENVLKFGCSNVIVTNSYPKDIAKSKQMFDIILADVPCSGEGMFRKDPESINQWSMGNVKQCQHLQRDIIETIWPCLRPGGILVYSTCTFNIHENEENIAWIAEELGATSIEIEIEKRWNILSQLTGTHPCYRFLPGVTKGEGLFVAVLRKSGDTSSKSLSQKRKTNNIFPNVISHGPLPDVVKGKTSTPHVSKVLSLDFIKKDYQSCDLCWREAISYLQGQSIILDAKYNKGFVTLTYKYLPIGICKNLGNRANNLYPQSWRIRTTHVPQEETTIFKI